MLDGHRRLLWARRRQQNNARPRGRGRVSRGGLPAAAGLLWLEHLGWTMAWLRRRSYSLKNRSAKKRRPLVTL